MANFNKIILLGNLTRDPQLSYLPSQTAVVDFGMAINRKYKKQDGSVGEEVCFVDCQAFGKPAETLNKYCKKGNLLFVEGRLKSDSWTKHDGSKASKHRVLIENFQLMPNGSGKPQQETAAAGQSEAGGGEPEYTPPNDDIPF